MRKISTSANLLYYREMTYKNAIEWITLLIHTIEHEE